MNLEKAFRDIDERISDLKDTLKKNLISKSSIEMEMSQQEIKWYKKNSNKQSLLHLSSKDALKYIMHNNMEQQLAYGTGMVAIMISEAFVTLLKYFSERHAREQLCPYIPSLTWKDNFRQLSKQSKMQQKGMNQPRKKKTLPKNRDNWKRIY